MERFGEHEIDSDTPVRWLCWWGLPAVAILVSGGCLSPDYDESCGPGGPYCYQNEVCRNGTCVPSGEGPAGSRDVGASDSVSETGEPTDGSADSAATDASPSDASHSDSRRVDARDTRGDLADVAESKRRPGGECEMGSECRAGWCVNGSCPHRVFVTRQVFSPDFGGASAADSRCEAAANDAGLSGEWTAMILENKAYSTPRFEVNAPVVNAVGEEMFARGSDFPAGPSNAPEYDARGKTVSDNLDSTGVVWTGWANLNRGAAKTCDDWSSVSTTTFGVVGDLGDTSGEKWLRSNETYQCAFMKQGQKMPSKAHLYCISQ